MSEQAFSKKLEEFIGREAILQDVSGWIQDGKFHIVFFSGEYGIGKTRLLQRILELARRELKYDGAPDKDRIIDLYHFRHHSPEGLARAIFKCFEQIDDKGYFNPFITSQRRLDAARAAGDSTAIREQLQEMLKNCVDGLKKMSSEIGALLLFDTAEQFVYPTGTRFAPAWDWLKDWVGDLPHGAVLFAGRPATEALFQGAVLAQLVRVPLDFFTLEESRAYVLKTGKNWSREENREAFEIDENDIPKLHALSQGRPILLAIFLELRMHDPQAFKDLSGLQKETFEQKVVEYLLNQPELGETLEAAGRTPKGINAELLAKIRGIPLRDAKRALENLSQMSFAKIFPDDDRTYLHDDMYDLLDQYIFSDVADAAERQDAAQAIYNYYKQAIRQKDEELKNIFANLTQEVDFKHATDSSSEDYVKRIRALEIPRQQLKTEFLYYRLRHQIAKGDRKAHHDDSIQAGLKNYYRFGHEAATSNNDEILIPLQIELTNFWLSLNEGDFWKPFIEGLLLIHEVWLKVATGQMSLEDIPVNEKSLSAISSLTPDQKIILHALLETWLGTGLVFAKEPEYDRAETIFTGSIDNLQKLSTTDQHLTWFRDVVVSLVYRQRAYMRRIRGAFQDSIEDFKSGLRYSRSIDFFHEESTLRNDLGFAQMQAGIFRSAFENMWDGLQLRYRVAIGHRIALSYSSLAQLSIATGAYEEARKYAQYAYSVAGAVGFRRGLGFGNLAYAEATRRYAFSAQGPSNQAEYLQQAKDAIDIAIHRIGQLGEKARIIDAKLEQACMYRDRMRIETELSKKKTWFEKSNDQFREVAKAAEEAGIHYRLVDAICNRVWLGYFANEMDQAEEAAREFETLDVLQPYWLKDGKFADETLAHKNPILWAQIGKYCVGRGMVELGKWEKEKKDKFLKEAAQYTMLGLTYSTAFAEDHRGLREGRRTIYQKLAALNPDELNQFSHYVLDAEKSEKIPKTPSALQLLMRDHALWFAD